VTGERRTVSQAVVAADFWLSIIELGKVVDRNVGLDGARDG
jgi:hypothetical protein